MLRIIEKQEFKQNACLVPTTSSDLLISSISASISTEEKAYME
jgi:hypothetical protein